MQNVFLQKVQMTLNLKQQELIRTVHVFLYTNEHVIIPRYSTGVYGGFFKKISLEEDVKKGYKGFFGEYYIIKNKLLAINRRGQRCINDGTQEPVGRCIVKKLEDDHNCTAYQLMANKTKEFCPKKQVGEINTANDDMSDISEADLANITGCLQSCNRDEISLKDSPRINSFYMGPNPTMTLSFLFHDGAFDVREEYLVYDTSSLMADVGGYMGLLVGQSVLGIYYFSTDWLTKIWRCACGIH